MHTVAIAGSGGKEDIFRSIEQSIAVFQPDVAYLHAVYDPEIIRWILTRLPSVAYAHGPYLVCPGSALYWRKSETACRRTAGLSCLRYAQLEQCCFGRNPLRHAQRLLNVEAYISAYSTISVLAGSTFMRRQLVASGVPADNVSILSPIISEGTISAYSRPSTPKRLLFAGRITAEKGLAYLIKALATIDAEWDLVVAGDGPDRPACQKLAADLGLQERIDFAGWLSSEDMDQLYGDCAIVVVPSLWPEPFGRIGPEAFAHGRPVAAFAVGGIPDWLEDGQTGFLAEPGNVEDISKKIAFLLERPDEQERMGCLALTRARTSWTAEAHVQELLSQFAGAITAFGQKAHS
jgi:glycosyltransferase involved in cell wall biosynthesis